MEKTQAIILHSLKVGDNQIIVDLFTKSRGRLSFGVHLSKSAKGSMKRQFFQPFMLLGIEFDFRGNVHLQKLRNVWVDTPLLDIPYSPAKLSICFFLSEFLVYSTRYEQENASLFTYIYNSIIWFDETRRPFSNFHIVFMLRFAFFVGLAPNLTIEQDSMVFDLLDGCFVPHVPLHSHYLLTDDSLKLISLFRLSYQTMHLYPMTRAERNRCVEVILLYYQLHIPGFPEMKSLSVLKELFD